MIQIVLVALRLVHEEISNSNYKLNKSDSNSIIQYLILNPLFLNFYFYVVIINMLYNPDVTLCTIVLSVMLGNK